MFWEHDVFDETGFFLRNLVGLAAVAVERSGTRLGEDVPGDEAAGDRGIPFREDDALSFDWEGPNAPNCPGGPFPPPVPLYCPASLTLVCVDCPKNVPQTGTSGPMNPSSVNVSAPDACLIEDVDVLLSIDHTWIGDLAVSLAGPAGNATLFSGICGSTDDWRGIVDDQAAAAVTANCGKAAPPTDRVKSQSGTALTGYNGKPAGGKWTLSINDNVGGDSGQLETWSLTIATSK
jgi:subtilisin-like proprotein convertase family protein